MNNHYDINKKIICLNNLLYNITSYIDNFKQCMNFIMFHPTLYNKFIGENKNIYDKKEIFIFVTNNLQVSVNPILSLKHNKIYNYQFWIQQYHLFCYINNNMQLINKEINHNISYNIILDRHDNFNLEIAYYLNDICHTFEITFYNNVKYNDDLSLKKLRPYICISKVKNCILYDDYNNCHICNTQCNGCCKCNYCKFYTKIINLHKKYADEQKFGFSILKKESKSTTIYNIIKSIINVDNIQNSIAVNNDNKKNIV